MNAIPALSFAAFSSLGALATLGLFVGSTVYDVRTIKKRRPRAKTPHAARYRRRPLVSVVVVAANNQSVVLKSLQSIVSSSYKKYEITIIDNVSDDGTAALIKQFAAKHAKKNIRIITKRKVHEHSKLLPTAVHSAKGELTIVMDANTGLFADTMKNIVNQFLLDDTLPALVARTASTQNYTVTNQVKQLGLTVRARLDKTRDVLGRNSVNTRFTAYRSALYARAVVPAYASDVVVRSIKNNSRKRNLSVQTSLLWLAWTLVGLGVGYIWYLALKTRVVEPLGVLWLGVACAGLVCLASDDRMTGREKLRSASLFPLWYIFSCLYVLKRAFSPLAILTKLRVRVSLVD